MQEDSKGKTRTKDNTVGSTPAIIAIIHSQPIHPLLPARAVGKKRDVKGLSPESNLSHACAPQLRMRSQSMSRFEREWRGRGLLSERWTAFRTDRFISICRDLICRDLICPELICRDIRANTKYSPVDYLTDDSTTFEWKLLTFVMLNGILKVMSFTVISFFSY